jgi:hypothetical protein
VLEGVHREKAASVRTTAVEAENEAANALPGKSETRRTGSAPRPAQMRRTGTRPATLEEKKKYGEMQKKQGKKRKVRDNCLELSLYRSIINNFLLLKLEEKEDFYSAANKHTFYNYMLKNLNS